MQLILCIVLLIAALIEFSPLPPSLPLPLASLFRTPLSTLLYSTFFCVCPVRVCLLLFVCISVCVCLLVYFGLFCLLRYRPHFSLFYPPLFTLPRCTFVRLFAAGILHFPLCSNYNFQLFSDGFFIYTNCEWFPSISIHFLLLLPLRLLLSPLPRQFVHSCMRSLSASFYLTFSVRAWK